MPDITKLAGVSRANAYQVPPELLQQVENSRRWDDTDVVDLALDILERGQKVTVLVDWDSDGNLVVHDGRRRVAAIRYINENGLSVDCPLKVRCEFDKVTKEESFTTAVVTNLKRKGLTAIDLAHSIATLEGHGKTRKEIAKLLEISEALISQTLKLLTLPAGVQRDIHKGKIAASIGYEMASLSPEDRAKATPAATPPATSAANGKPTHTREESATPTPTRESVRAVKREKAERGEETTGPKSRSRKVVYNLFSDWAGCDDGTIEDDIKALCATLVKYFDGEVGDRAVLNRMRELSGEA